MDSDIWNLVSIKKAQNKLGKIMIHLTMYACDNFTTLVLFNTFYKHFSFEGATSHIDDKYGIDVDDIFNINDALAPIFKENYSIQIFRFLRFRNQQDSASRNVLQ